LVSLEYFQRKRFVCQQNKEFSIASGEDYKREYTQKKGERGRRRRRLTIPLPKGKEAACPFVSCFIFICMFNIMKKI